MLKFNKCKNNRLPYASSSNDCALAYCSLGSPVVVLVALSVVAAFAFPSSLNCRFAMLVCVCVCVLNYNVANWS